MWVASLTPQFCTVKTILRKAFRSVPIQGPLDPLSQVFGTFSNGLFYLGNVLDSPGQQPKKGFPLSGIRVLVSVSRCNMKPFIKIQNKTCWTASDSGGQYPAAKAC